MRLGYSASMHHSKVIIQPPHKPALRPPTHVVLVVTWPGCPSQYLCDVGFPGVGPHEPIPVVLGDYVQFGQRLRLDGTDVPGVFCLSHRVESIENQATDAEVAAAANGGASGAVAAATDAAAAVPVPAFTRIATPAAAAATFTPSYTFDTRVACAAVDFHPNNVYIATLPSSLFVNHRWITAPVMRLTLDGGGTFTRHTLFDNNTTTTTYTISPAGAVTHSDVSKGQLASAEEFARFVKEHMQVDLTPEQAGTIFSANAAVQP